MRPDKGERSLIWLLYRRSSVLSAVRFSMPAKLRMPLLSAFSSVSSEKSAGRRPPTGLSMASRTAASRFSYPKVIGSGSGSGLSKLTVTPRSARAGICVSSASALRGLPLRSIVSPDASSGSDRYTVYIDLQDSDYLDGSKKITHLKSRRRSKFQLINFDKPSNYSS